MNTHYRRHFECDNIFFTRKIINKESLKDIRKEQGKKVKKQRFRKKLFLVWYSLWWHFHFFWGYIFSQTTTLNYSAVSILFSLSLSLKHTEKYGFLLCRSLCMPNRKVILIKRLVGQMFALATTLSWHCASWMSREHLALRSPLKIRN